MKQLFLTLLWCLIPLQAWTQETGTCEPAQAEAYLDVNNVRAAIFNNGSLFWQGGQGAYEVPKGSGIHAIFNTNVWVGGLIEGQLRVAAARYGNHQFWPGPLDQSGNPPNDCQPYDRIYEITHDEIRAYNASGVITDNPRHWPWQLGAPVLDGDKNPDNYNLEGGDRPELMGDQMLWWVMNDAGNEHAFVKDTSRPLGMEIQGSAFAFIQPHSYIGTTTFYRFKLINKNNKLLEAAYFGLYVNSDLGNFDDDYIGADTLLHLGFTYNADNDDEGIYGYGRNPPALGYTFLGTSTNVDGRDNDYDGQIDEPGEQQGMTSFMYFYGGGGVDQEPLMAHDYYYYMQAIWKDGKPVTFGGGGRKFSTIPSKYFYPGDPITRTFWSERNVYGSTYPDIYANVPSDRIFLLITGPFTLQPGDSEEITFAIVWSRGSDHLDSVRQLKTDVRSLRANADQILTPTTFQEVLPSKPNPVLGFAQNYPNPFNETTTIRYSLPKQAQVQLAVYDVLGREIAALVEAEQEAGIHSAEFDASDLPAGLYLARLQIDSFTFTKKLVVAR